MATQKLPEVWLRGAVENIPSLLQPVAHALLQAREEVNELMIDFRDELLWIKPAGAASVGFHLQHLSGVLDRLYTYVHEKPLSQEQFAQLKAEGDPLRTNKTTSDLLKDFDKQVDTALKELHNIREEELTQPRSVGRAQFPSTVIGLLFHSAEHTMRHVGQLIVTLKVVNNAATK